MRQKQEFLINWEMKYYVEMVQHFYKIMNKIKLHFNYLIVIPELIMKLKTASRDHAMNKHCI